MSQEIVTNRKAYHDYTILQKFESGIVLKGSEIKSLRNHGGSLQDAFVIIDENELWLLNSTIAPYSHSGSFSHEERRKRKLLMHKNEILRLKKDLQEKGISLIPLSMYFKKGKVKVEIALVKGKKSFDKRQAIKAREEKRSIERAIRQERD
jgi:SsrA-binding protein